MFFFLLLNVYKVYLLLLLLFAMSIIQLQHLHKAFFPVSFKCSQPGFVLGINYPCSADCKCCVLFDLLN